MRFGLLYEHQLPRPWTEGTEHRLFKDALAQVELADRLGIDYIWEVEHHFLEEYAHSSAPEVFLAACAARTKQHPHRPRRRAGAARLQPSRPRRRAHRHARPDLRRPGRLGHRRIGLAGRARRLRHRSRAEEGDVGRGGRADRQHDGDEPLSRLPGQVLLHAGAQRRAQAAAEAASADLGGVQPSRETIHAAARAGIGALTFAFVDPAEAGKWAHEYYEIIKSDECVPIGHTVNANIAMVTGFSLPRGSRRGAAARRRGLPVLRLFARPLLRLRPSPAGRHRRLAALRGGQGQAAGRSGRAAASARRPS